jgi:hypothetical protein
MIRVGDRVRHKVKEIDEQYGVLEVWNIKGTTAICRYGDFNNLGIANFKLIDLIKE